MRFGHVFASAFDPHALFEVHRDELEAFGPRLNGVREVRRLSRETNGVVQRLRHRWAGDPAVLPGPLRLFVPSRLFVWEDRTIWDAEARTGRWVVTAPSVGDVVRLEGTHTFAPRDGGSEVTVEGRLEVALVQALGGRLAQDFVRRLFEDILRGSLEVIETFMRERSLAVPGETAMAVEEQSAAGARRSVEVEIERTVEAGGERRAAGDPRRVGADAEEEAEEGA